MTSRLSDHVPILQDPDAAAEQETRHLIATPASGMRIRAPKWLWDRRIPAGAITLIAGREGIGKSTCAADIIARATTGRLEGRFEGKPQGVAIVATEDAWAEVIVPRLIVARADLTKVFRIDAKEPDGHHDIVSVPKDLAQLADLCAAHNIVLVVIDPIMSVIDGKFDTHKDRDVRQALDPLARFASTNAVAVLGLIHVNKSGKKDPAETVMASKAFVAVARSVLYCVIDPDDEDEETFVFGHIKSNLGPKMPSRKYEITEAKVDVPDPEPGDDTYVTTSRIKWGEEDQRTIRELIEPKEGDRPTGELAQSIEALLRDRGALHVDEICRAIPDAPRNTVTQNLTRMTKRGTLLRVVRGVYRLPGDDPDDAADDTPDDNTDTVITVTSVTKQDRDDANDTHDIKDVSREVSPTVSLPQPNPSPWGADTHGGEIK